MTDQEKKVWDDAIGRAVVRLKTIQMNLGDKLSKAEGAVEEAQAKAVYEMAEDMVKAVEQMKGKYPGAN